ncbi:MAG: cation:proton antiporter, partial [Phenylobacterium sp.]
EGESLLNDAAALLIYRLAVGAVAAGGFSLAGAAPAFALVFIGSVVAGWLTARAVGLVMSRIHDAPSAVILQFVGAFGVWLAAERLGLSGVVTIVVFGLSAAHQKGPATPARLRVPSFAIWETAAVVLNVLAFTLVGLQLGPIWEALSPTERVRYLLAAFALLGVVIAVRLAWVFIHQLTDRAIRRLFRLSASATGAAPSVGSAFVVGWSGMRGIVTLGAALAVPTGFPYRDFIQLAAFVVVLGTLVLQGLTLGPLLRGLALPKDDVVDRELSLARNAVLKAALKVLDGDATPSAERLRQEYAEALGQARRGTDPYDTPDSALRRQIVGAGRAVLDELRSGSAIGDEAYRRIEEELDWRELSLGREG